MKGATLPKLFGVEGASRSVLARYPWADLAISKVE